jgi:serine/threonine-protein kinase
MNPPETDPVPRLNTALEGRYRIESELGEGGMATVYLADDLKHERKVALKVLKPELAAVVGAERFLAEIKTTANLQHPHILPLHDSGEADSFLYYVMPYIEGETLADRLERDKQLPVDEALGIATAVANALHTAHEQGVVHRDIKPGNILMSRGEPLVADFGIAIAVSAGGSGRLTETGLSLGTPYYMSPEQATGDQSIGPASDTFALACVLYEMLVGEPPYPGSTAQAVLGKIIQGAPVSATAVRRSVPANVDAAIRKALEKLPADRFTGANDFAKALADPSFRHGADGFAGVGASSSPWNRLSVAMTAVAALFAITTAVSLLRSEPELVRPVERFAAPFLEGEEPSFRGFYAFALSPDGTMLLYGSSEAGAPTLMARRWDDLAAVPLRETALGFQPSVSPDGLEFAFRQSDQIKVAAFAGGPVRTLTTGDSPKWGEDGFIYVETDSGVVRVPARGGAIETVTTLSDGERAHTVWDLLPGGRGALMVASGATREIRALDLRTGEMTPIAEGRSPRYINSGHLVFAAIDGSMMAARFDPDRMELLGTPVAVMDGVSGWTLSDDGKLFYASGSGGASGANGPSLQLAWVTRTGQASVVDPDWTFDRGEHLGISLDLSPDGSTVAVREFAQGGYDIYLKELDAGVRRRLTFDEAHDKSPVWEPGGENITFLSDRNGNFDVWSRAADGTGQPELILDAEEDLERIEWSPDGEWLLAWTVGDDILSFRPRQDSVAMPLFATPADEMDPAISPDGRWIAYVSRETGTLQAYVQPFPDVSGARYQVSAIDARMPRWSHDGRELFYQDQGASPSTWVVEVEAGDVFRFGTPTRLFNAPEGWNGSGRYAEEYQVAPGDERFLIPVRAAEGGSDALAAPPYVLVNNFAEVLKRMVPEGG